MMTHSKWMPFPSSISFIKDGKSFYAPRLAYAIHLYNQERAMHNQSVINLKGFFAANGVIDYTFDPHVTAVDLLLNFGIVPLHLKEDYDKNNCHVEWVFFYIY